jgi:hypothetical protein
MPSRRSSKARLLIVSFCLFPGSALAQRNLQITVTSASPTIIYTTAPTTAVTVQQASGTAIAYTITDPNNSKGPITVPASQPYTFNFPSPVCASGTYVGQIQLTGTNTSAVFTVSQTSHMCTPLPTVINNQPTFQGPAITTSVITSLTSDGTNIHVTCNYGNTSCGVSDGISVNLGNTLPAGCRDAIGNTSHSGNVLLVSSTAQCPTGGGTATGTWPNSILAYPTVIATFQTAGGDPNHVAQIDQTADGHWVLKELINGQESAALDMRNDGLFALRSDVYGTGFSVDTSQDACVGGNIAAFEGSTCPGFGVGYSGLATRYDGQAIVGLSVPVYKASGAFTGDYSNLYFYTAPGSGLGGNTMYHIKGVFQEGIGVPESTLFVTISWKDAVTNNLISMSTCTVETSNLNCMGTAAVATSMATSGTIVPFDLTFTLGNSQSVSISTLTSNSPTGFFFYQLYMDNN